MAWIFGLVTREELEQLRDRGWEPSDREDLEAVTKAPFLWNFVRPESVHKMVGFFVDADLFEIMSGPDWEKDKTC